MSWFEIFVAVTVFFQLCFLAKISQDLEEFKEKLEKVVEQLRVL